MAVGFVNMKDAGDTDRFTMGGMERGEENWSAETEPVCESLESGRKVGTRESFLFACFVFSGGRYSGCSVCSGE